MSKHWDALSRGGRWLTGGIAAIVLAAMVAWVLFVPAADWFARHDVGSTTGPLHETALDNARGRLLTLGAGLFAAGALVFTARNFTVSRRTLELTEQGQVTDRYTKAIEQLGSDKLDVRIGGIYALERVARDSVRDHPTVMEVLTAFIREHSREPWPEPDPGGQEQERSIRPDVQAAVTVVGRRDPALDVRRIELFRANLSYADLRLANLSYADLHLANLSHADLSGANLRGVDLSRANLSRADLTAADLTAADLTDADLTRADLWAADLSATDFSLANLSRALWPKDGTVPRGWKRGPGLGELSRES
jgi:Pentapeptide repeats (8 copies)